MRATGARWTSVLTGPMIALVVLGFDLVGDGLRAGPAVADAVRPKPFRIAIAPVG